MQPYGQVCWFFLNNFWIFYIKNSGVSGTHISKIQVIEGKKEIKTKGSASQY